MEQITVDKSICNQRFDKFLKKYLPNASTGFLFKMLRKKNILLNNQKATGNEILKVEDMITIYFSDDTLQNFKISEESIDDLASQYMSCYQKYKDKVSVLYENEHILILNKPVGLLSQKSTPADISINEVGIGYLLETKQLSSKSLAINKPSICNRLDRNTSGIILFGKTLLGLQTLNDLIKQHTLKKYYRCFLYGILKDPIDLTGYLSKNEKTNIVKVSNSEKNNSTQIKTKIKPISYGSHTTYVEIELITGKTHQIRAHVASIGHPIIGDFKYGTNEINQKYKEQLSITSQLLHAYRIEFPVMINELSSISEKEIIAPLPNTFHSFLDLYFK